MEQLPPISHLMTSLPSLPGTSTTSSLLLFLIVTALSWYWLRQYGLYKSEENPVGCQKLGSTNVKKVGLNGKVQHASSKSANNKAKWKVDSLWIYPIKSCRGVELQNAIVTGTGFQYDRQFAFAQYQKTSKPNQPEKWGWNFMTQRTMPKMATIRTEIWIPDSSSSDFSEGHSNAQSGGVLVIKYPGGKKQTDVTIHLPFNPTKEQIDHYKFEKRHMTIWRDSPAALLMASTEMEGSWINQLQSYLNVSAPLALFRSIDHTARELHRNAPSEEQLGYQPTVDFQDSYPLHIMNAASVRDIGEKFEGGAKTLSYRNFRPNIVISGGAAYAEDSWKLIEMGGERYHVCCRTVRCLLPNVNPITGERKDEPNKTLKQFRKIDQGDPKNACLGMQMVPAVQDKRGVRVGDEITVLETGQHRYIRI